MSCSYSVVPDLYFYFYFFDERKKMYISANSQNMKDNNLFSVMLNKLDDVNSSFTKVGLWEFSTCIDNIRHSGNIK